MSRRAAYLIAIGALMLCTALWFWTGQDDQAPIGRIWDHPLVDRDIDEIRPDTLRILVIEHPLVHERLKGDETGLEFELLERFARRERIPIKAISVEHVDSLLPRLQRGMGDVIAARLGLDGIMEHAIARSRPWRYVRPMIATLRADRVLGIERVERPDTLWTGKGSPFAFRDLFDGDVPHNGTVDPVLLVDTTEAGDAPLVNVALGRVRAALVSDALAAYAATRFPQLDFRGPVGDPVPLVFGLRRNSIRLRKAMDAWLTDPEEKEALGMIMSAYGSRVPERGPLGHRRKLHLEGDSLSPYDSLFQQNQIRHDWELLAAIAFKESRFDSTAVSHRGAQGLMQMMPRTAHSTNTDSLHLVDGQIQAAAKYLASLDTIWLRGIPDPDERLRFVLAAYNAGPGHVLDAQRLATALGLDPHKWEGHVERAITLLALPEYFTRTDVQSGPCQGSQTFNYVREVTGLYEQFVSITGGG